MDSLNRDQDGKPLKMVETDVLGLEKSKTNLSGTKAKPNRIFIVIAILVILAAIYWFANK